MPIPILAVLREAWALFRRDRDWLLALVGPFLFLPSFALALLVPDQPPIPERTGAAGDARLLAWAERSAEWFGQNGAWYVLAFAFGAYGASALSAAYLDGRAGTVGEALRRAAPLLPRYLLATVLVSLPVGAGLLLFLPLGIYLLGRTMVTGPVLVAERPVGAATAVARAFSLSSGAGLPLMALASVPLLGGLLLGQPFLLLERGADERQILLVLAATGEAAALTFTNLAQLLIAVVAYRRLLAR